MKGHIMSALLEKLVSYTLEPGTPEKDLQERAIGIVLKGGHKFKSVVVDRFDADNKLVSVREIGGKKRDCHILVDEIAAVLGPTAAKPLFISGAK
jgi:hypothetical protein